MLVKSIHPFVLTKFVSKQGEFHREKSQAEKEEEAAAAAADHKDEDEDSYEDDNTWLCDGSKRFKNGCKGG